MLETTKHITPVCICRNIEKGHRKDYIQCITHSFLLYYASVCLFPCLKNTRFILEKIHLPLPNQVIIIPDNFPAIEDNKETSRELQRGSALPGRKVAVVVSEPRYSSQA